jgi:hypothetical protein
VVAKSFRTTTLRTSTGHLIRVDLFWIDSSRFSYRRGGFRLVMLEYELILDLLSLAFITTTWPSFSDEIVRVGAFDVEIFSDEAARVRHKPLRHDVPNFRILGPLR